LKVFLQALVIVSNPRIGAYILAVFRSYYFQINLKFLKVFLQALEV